MVLPFGFGKEIHFGETSTTVTLDYSDTAEDFNVCETSDCWEDAGYQGRWDVSSIPSVTSAVICLYGGEDDGTLDTDYRYWRVNDQTWTDSMSAAQANAQSVTNQTDGTWDNAPANAEWSCADVTNAVKTDVLLNNNFTTIRLVDVDALLSSIAGVDGSWSFIYYGSVSNFVGFRPSEYAGDSTKRPYMNITYSTDSCSCPGAGTEWQWDFADECTISTACTVENITCINSGTWKITSQVTATENFCKLAPGQNLKVGGQLKYKNGGT